ncbi:hypothetical protein WR11_26135 [Escherichia coli]|nr:hypothetical protein WR11_26135 [Escherichia coli]GDW75416.1 hypothetical protein BvCmsSIP019_04099 [Escherichia coli]
MQNNMIKNTSKKILKLYHHGTMDIMVKMLSFIKHYFSDTESISPEAGVFCVRHMISVTWKTHGFGNYFDEG